MNLDATLPFEKTIERAREAEKGVNLLLRSGSNLAGRIAGIGDHYVVLTEISGRGPRPR